MKKILITTGAAFTAIALTTLTFAWVQNNLETKADREVIRTAIESNNYASLSDTAKTQITEALFATMVAKNMNQQAELAAIDSGDYTAFRNAKIAKIPDESVFNAITSMKKAQTAAQADIEASIKSNDFTAFKKAHTDLKTTLDTLKAGKPRFEQNIQTDEQLQKHFDSLVTQYNDDGTLPKGPGKNGIMWMNGGRDMHDIMWGNNEQMRGYNKSHGKGNK